LYFSPNIIQVIKSRRMRWVGDVAHMEDRRGANRVLVARPDGKRPHGKPRHKCEDNMKMDFKDVGSGGMDWVSLTEDRDD
jgi:hypothetical protein